MTSKPPTTSSNTTSTPPPSSSPSTNFEYVSRAKHNIYSKLATRRPWRQVFDYHAFVRPNSPYTIFSRLKTNLAYFHPNFAIIILFILFLSLIYEPWSLVIFLIMMVLWLFLFFLRDEPLVLFGRIIDERIVLVVLSVLTVGFLLFGGATYNIVMSLLIGFGIVVIYSVLRKTDDLFLDEDDAAEAGLLAGQTGPGAGHYHQSSSSH